MNPQKMMIRLIGSLLMALNILAGGSKSLCDLQRSVKMGEKRLVRVDGTYSNGFEMGILTNAACPSRHTWVELDLQSTTNKELLRATLDSSGRANVVLEGEFFGPESPNQKLPEAIRKSYRPGWGHLGAFKTKLVVHVIRTVRQEGESAGQEAGHAQGAPAK